MLNPFPIQWLALFAYAILRVCVGGILIYLGMRHLRHRKSLREALQLSWWPFGTFSTLTLVSAELILGTLFILGAHTQYAALALFLLSLKFLVLVYWL